MLKRSFLLVFAAVLFCCSATYGQQFQSISPSDLGFNASSGPVNGIFDISTFLSESPNTVSIEINNGNISSITDSWTVGEGSSTTFTLSGSKMVDAFVNHGRNLGSEAFQNGSLARDGITAANGESWTLTSPLDSDYTAGQNGNDYFVDYTGAETNQLENNAVGFRWGSDQPVSSFSVFSRNSTNLDNNYTVGFRTVEAVPEPAAGMLIALAGMFVLRRKRS